jgi:hypothetical protein
MQEPNVDAFILFNERESAIESLVGELTSRGISTYFWRRDVPLGDDWEDLEARRLREAHVVLVFLGAAGWGPNHLRITEEVQGIGKRILPILIGDPPEGALSQANGLFHSRRYLDLRDSNALPILVNAIRGREPSVQVDRIVSVLIDGSDTDRADVLRQVRVSRSIDRPVLAARLRSEILQRFAPHAERTVRDPSKISSIRSWMLSALIGVDAEGKDTRDLILHSLKASWEPAENVRFWALAGLYGMRASYLEEGAHMATSDDASEVAALAEAILSPKSPDVIGAFKARLHADVFEKAWPVLRALRVAAIPELAADVCKQLGRSASGTFLTYDALYALSNPIMAREAIRILTPRAVVGFILDEVPNSDRNSLRNFAMLLASFSGPQVDALLEEAERAPATSDGARLIRRLLAEQRRQGDGNDLFVAGYASDTIDLSKDPLGVQEDVQTLTAVMIAREVTPPLAIGLFGDWGTGKSYFMESMKVAAEKLASSGSAHFCTNIVPIKFNAWHYVDTNLWASLVSTILEKLCIRESRADTRGETGGTPGGAEQREGGCRRRRGRDEAREDSDR